MKNKNIFSIIAFLVILPLISKAQINLNNGLIAHYTFSGNADDISGNNLDGTVTGATLTTDRFGRSNSAYFFDNSNDNINIPFDALLNLTGEKSISLWYRIDSTLTLSSTPTIIYMQSQSWKYYPTYAIQLNNHYTYGVNEDKISAFFGSAGSNNYAVTSTQEYNDYANQWVHLVYTYSQSDGYIRIYWNGVLSQSFYTGNRTSNTSIGGLQIGRAGNTTDYANTNFVGDIDDIRLYDRPLNADEVDSLYNIGEFNLGDSLIAYYPFTGTGNDFSGNDLHGTAFGPTLTLDRFGDSNSAYHFDGTNDYFNVPFDSLLNLRGNKSISLWYKIDSGTSLNTTPTLIHMKNASDLYYPTYAIQLNNHYTYGSSQNKISAFFGSSSSNYAVTTSELYNNYRDQWVHLVFTYSQSDGYLRIYWNGQLSSSYFAGSITSNSSNADLQIGRNNSDASTYFEGDIDDIRIYSRAINPSEVSALYDATYSRGAFTQGYYSHQGALNNDNVSNSVSSVNNIYNNNIKIYPNPASDYFNISIDKPGDIYIYDSKGSLLSIQNVNLQNTKVDVSNLPNGIYLIKLIQGNEFKIGKLLK